MPVAKPMPMPSASVRRMHRTPIGPTGAAIEKPRSTAWRKVASISFAARGGAERRRRRLLGGRERDRGARAGDAGDGLELVGDERLELGEVGEADLEQIVV